MKGGFMEVFFYKAPLCPRCFAAERHLKRVLSGMDHELHVLDVFRHRKAARADGVTIAPTIRMEGRMLSGLWLTERQIRDFVEGGSGGK